MAVKKEAQSEEKTDAKKKASKPKAKTAVKKTKASEAEEIKKTTKSVSEKKSSSVITGIPLSGSWKKPAAKAA